MHLSLVMCPVKLPSASLGVCNLVIVMLSGVNALYSSHHVKSVIKAETFLSVKTFP